MYKNILVPVAPDARNDTARAFRTARRLADVQARITALSVFEPVPEYIRLEADSAREDELRAAALADLRSDLEETVDVAAVPGQPGRAIVKWAEDHAVDCIVMASSRPEMTDFFMGSTAARVVRHAGCAVHVLR